MKESEAIFVFIASLVFFFQPSFSDAAAPWPQGYKIPFSYKEETGRGPSKWGQLNPNWTACGNGTRQSPINLGFQDLIVLPFPGDLRIQYQPANATIKNLGFEIQVSWRGNAGSINVGGENYNLKQCHWHIPTEHTFDGVRYDLELHVVHENSNGRIAVLGILYRIGLPDPFLSRLLPFIRTVTKEGQELGIVDPGEIGFGSNSRRYYRYNGSLTTPPCTEGVLWTVFRQVRTASVEQVNALRNAVDDGYEMNARPIQALNGRPVFLFYPLIQIIRSPSE